MTPVKPLLIRGLIFFVGKIKKTVSQLSREIDVPQTTLNNIASGRSKPGYKVLEPLARAGLDIHWLITGEGDMMREHYSKKIINHGNNINQFGGNNNKGVSNEFNDGGSIAALQQEMTTLKVQLEEKERLIAEKERLIQVLLEKR